MSDAAPVVRSDDPASFPYRVWADRHPVLIRDVRGALPYGPAQRRALDALLDETLHGVVAPLDGDPWWEDWGVAAYVGRSWLEVPFLWAESWFYRRLLHAVGHFTPGPWYGVDPFRPFKRAELTAPETAREIAALDALAVLPLPERRAALLHASLWGNRADLGFRIQSGAEKPPTSGLVADDSESLWKLPAGGTVVLVADNAGRELLPDLYLLDHLLTEGGAEGAVLHLKPSPYYVSDATTADLVDAVRLLVDTGTDAGPRLWDALTDGRLEPRAHPFSCGPLPYEDAPDDLRADFAAADLTIMKGDLNYRRLVGDRHWLPATGFADVTSYFPGPVAALRTLKSDVVTGLTEETAAGLDATEGPGTWRTSGTHALVQVGGAGAR